MKKKKKKRQTDRQTNKNETLRIYEDIRIDENQHN